MRRPMIEQSRVRGAWLGAVVVEVVAAVPAGPRTRLKARAHHEHAMRVRPGATCSPCHPAFRCGGGATAARRGALVDVASAVPKAAADNPGQQVAVERDAVHEPMRRAGCAAGPHAAPPAAVVAAGAGRRVTRRLDATRNLSLTQASPSAVGMRIFRVETSRNGSPLSRQ